MIAALAATVTTGRRMVATPSPASRPPGSRSGSGARGSEGASQIRPSRSATSAAGRRAARAGIGAAGSRAGISTHRPSPPNRQPWYGHRSVPLFNSPADSRARRCGHSSANAATAPPNLASTQP